VRKIFTFILILFLVCFVCTPKAKAYDPTIVANNHFGMHVVDTSHLKDVGKLINSNGGGWGYVTFVIQKGERDPKRWQSAFDEMRRLHIIPIVRIATAPIGNIWEKPTVDEIDGWVSFLNSLNWVIKNRYVIIGNEPNHASEWGGEIDPGGYAKYLKSFSQKLKNSNEDFFIMPAGFDASAGNTKESMEESLYLSKILESDPQVFQYIDGWASHSYPNPGFGGSGDGYGKGTVRTYNWELNYLKYLGVSKDLPVFITETGWAHKTDSTITDIGPKIETAFKNAWNDKRIVAVTPFIFKYTASPFDVFSWVNKDGQFYDFYQNVFDLLKTKGMPIQEYKADVITGILPKIATVNSNYNGVMIIRNIGQSIWNKENIKLISVNNENININSMYPAEIEPNGIGVFLISGKYPEKAGNYNNTIELVNSGEVFNNQFQFSTNLIPNLPNFSEILDYIKTTILRLVHQK